MLTHYEIFCYQLAIKFPASGHALWEPDPANISTAVEVGDVGYICEGRFRRLFNALLEWTIKRWDRDGWARDKWMETD